MADQEQLELLKQGKEVWNNWRRTHPQVTPNFMHAILEYHDLNGFDLSGARLMNADLEQTFYFTSWTQELGEKRLWLEPTWYNAYETQALLPMGV